MSKKKWALVVLILMVVSNFLLFRYLPFISQFTTMKVTLTSDHPGEYQVFYSDDGIYSADQSVTAQYKNADETDTLEFSVRNMAYFRMDFGSEAATIEVEDISFVCAGKTMSLGADAFLESTERNDIASVEEGNGTVILTVEDEDPRLVLNLENYDFHFSKLLVEDESSIYLANSRQKIVYYLEEATGIIYIQHTDLVSSSITPLINPDGSYFTYSQWKNIHNI